MFATRAELDAWVERHHVAYILDETAEPLYDLLPADRPAWVLRALARASIGDVAIRDHAAREISQATGAMIAQAAERVLRAAAVVVADGLVEERARPATIVDPVLAPTWLQLLRVRSALRATAVPRARGWRAMQRWEFDASTATIRWHERERLVDREQPWRSIVVIATLTMTAGEVQVVHCTCGAAAGCVHALAMIDSTLDLLADPARADAAHAIVGELVRPGWARALHALAQVDAPIARPRLEVWWHIEYQLGTPTLLPIVKKQLKRGGWSAGARMSAERLLDDHGTELADRDLRIAEQLVAWRPGVRGRGSFPARAFAAAVGHPRLAATDVEPDAPIELARVALGFIAIAAGDHLRLQPALGNEVLSPRLLSALLDAFEPGEPLLALEHDPPRALLIDVSDDARRVWTALATHGDVFPPASHPALLERLAQLHAHMPIVVPDAVKGHALAAALTTVVRVRLLPDLTLELELFVRPGPGAPLFVPGSGPRDILLVRDGVRGYVRRDLGAEPAIARGLLARLPFDSAVEAPPGCFHITDPDDALAVVAAFESPPPGLEAEWIDVRPTFAPALQVASLHLRIARQRDWFGLAGDVKVEHGRLELAVLLDAARRQRRFVRIGEHRWIELADTLRKRLEAIADHAFTRRDRGERVELSPGAVPAIGALVDAGAALDAAPEWAELTARLAASRTLTPRVPTTLVATLRDYQRAGHAWLSRIAAWGAGACLADDMGLGKTIQAIAMLLDRAKLGPALVIAPTSVAHNWVRELARFAPTLRPIIYGDHPDRAACLARAGKRDIVIVSYGLLVRDAELLASTRFATLVLDEAQALKNANTKRARAARNLDAAFRIAMSGTPFENHLGELWSLFSIVFPGLFGSWDQFRDRFASPIEHGDDQARAALSRVLQPFLLRRTKAEVARELPPRTEIAVPIELSADERALYEDARLAAVASLTGGDKVMRDAQRRFQVLGALTRLRLLASHPKLYDATSTVASSKLARVVELLDELRREGHRALVFSQFTSHLAIVRTALDHGGFTSLYLDGATPTAQRAHLIEQFQGGTGDVFLISLTAGGTGVNLTAADYVIHLDPWWNPAVEDQASDRAHRIGQTKPVTIYRLIARGTIEEQIVSLHASKRALVAGVLDGTDVAGKLSAKQLLALISDRSS